MDLSWSWEGGGTETVDITYLPFPPPPPDLEEIIEMILEKRRELWERLAKKEDLK